MSNRDGCPSDSQGGGRDSDQAAEEWHDLMRKLSWSLRVSHRWWMTVGMCVGEGGEGSEASQEAILAPTWGMITAWTIAWGDSEAFNAPELMFEGDLLIYGRNSHLNC